MGRRPPPALLGLSLAGRGRALSRIKHRVTSLAPTGLNDPAHVDISATLSVYFN